MVLTYLTAAYIYMYYLITFVSVMISAVPNLYMVAPT